MTNDALLPSVARRSPGAGRFSLDARVPIVLGLGATDGDFRTALALQERLAAKGAPRLPIETHARTDGLGPRIELARDGDEGQRYRIDVARNRVQVVGAGPAGLRYGVETLAQLPGPRGRSLSCGSIEDAPDLDKRGLLIDVSRGKVPKLETLKELVELMARLKLNLLMLYTEHVFRFRRHPRVGRDDSPMTAEEIRELDAHAAAHHVELVPTLQSLGHMHQWLAHARYRRLAESEKRWSISPALPESYALLDDLYAEYLPNFRSSWFNANCDEPVDLGKGRSKEWAEREGKGAVFVAHLERVRELAARYGKQTMAWADVVFEHPDQVPRLPRDVVLIDWWYEADHDFDRVGIFEEHGIPFVVAAGTSSWNTLFPRLTNALANIRGYAEAGKKHGARGLVVTDWGDGGHYNLLGNSLFAFAFGAQAAWGPANLTERDFDRAFSVNLFGDESRAAARLHRRLGGAHGTGFDHFNHSPLKSVYFDDLSAPKFSTKAKGSALRATRKQLVSVLTDLERNGTKLAARPANLEELRFAAEASLFAVDKGLLSLEALGLEEERPALANRLRAMAEEQRRLERRHHALWLRRNRPSNYEITRGYYDASIRGLRRSARRRSAGSRKRKR